MSRFPESGRRRAPLTPPGSGALSFASRQRDLSALESGPELDVLVIGGGVVGAGCALDAVTRGLRVGLVEARDWASGTSSRSSKLIHGGLRYLEMLDFGLVREALHERGLMLSRLAPHLVHPVPFLYPLHHHLWERAYVGAGVGLYDVLSRVSGTAGGLHWHRQLSRDAALRLVPSLAPDSLVGAVQYLDAQVDDARHTVTIVRTAAAFGALCANRARVTGFLSEGTRIAGVRLVDLESGRGFRVRSRSVVLAGGVWTGDLLAMAGAGGRISIRASKGVHVLVPRDRIRSSTGLIVRTEMSVLFVIPWRRHWIIGTTDTPWHLDRAHPAASAADIDYLLGQVNKVLVAPLVRSDVQGVYAGLRPLLAGESDSTSKLSREHRVITPRPGLVAVAGGKYTTYRVMAEQAVGAAARSLDGPVAESRTARIPLVGAAGFDASRPAVEALAASSGLPPWRIEHLLGRYGSLVPQVLALTDPDRSLADPVTGAEDYLRVEVVYAVAREGARHVDDVLARRTRASVETPSRGVDSAAEVAALMAPLLGWSDRQIEREVEYYCARVAAERRSQSQWDDAAADAARLSAPEIVPLAPLS